MKKIKSKISIIIIIAVILVVAIVGIINANIDGPRKIGSAHKLKSIYGRYGDYGESFLEDIKRLFYFVIASPWAEMDIDYDYYYYDRGGTSLSSINNSTNTDFWAKSLQWYSGSTSSSREGSENESGSDFSKTNVQVENVDEADVIKTDGEYIYSISGGSVIITDARDPENPVVVYRFENMSTISSPEEILLYDNKIIIIGSSQRYVTAVDVYDISNKENPIRVESYSVDGRYYTSRLTDGKLYVISTGSLDIDDGEVDTTYTEKGITRNISYNKMYYFNKRLTTAQTTISTLDLDKENAKVDVSLYLLGLDNLYVSENNMYLVADDYYQENMSFFKILFKLLGVRGALAETYYMFDGDYSNSNDTIIYKFALNNGKIEYVGKGETDGTTIDQFSLDEYNSNLRVALYSGKGSRVVVFNEKMNKIGETERIAKGEKMYSTRFIGDRGYMVTYLNTDPLFTFDLSDPKHPEVLGELQISGYSTYLHPYDENHLIGIGYESTVRTNRTSDGRVSSQYAVITGMKMALFDVSNINNPIKISETIIGNSQTRSAILTNHKALLFSKEKGIIAIPVNFYSDELAIEDSSGNLSTIKSSYTDSLKDYKSEGYLVYGINLNDGFTNKGLIEHGEVDPSTYLGTNLIRGVYIKDCLFTVSQGMIKVNNLDTLDEISSLLLIEGVE